MPGSVGEHQCENCGRFVYGGDLLTVCPYCMHALPKAERAEKADVAPLEAAPAVPELEPVSIAPVPEPEPELPVFSDAPDPRPPVPPPPPPLPRGPLAAPPPRPAAAGGRRCGCCVAGCMGVLAAVGVALLMFGRGEVRERAARAPIAMQQATQTEITAPEVRGALASLSQVAVLSDNRLCFAGSLRNELRVLQPDGGSDHTYMMPGNVRSVIVTPMRDLLLLTPGMAYFLGSDLEPTTSVAVPETSRAAVSLGRDLIFVLVDDEVLSIEPAGAVVHTQHTSLTRPRLGGIDERGRLLLHRAGQFELMDPRTGDSSTWRMPAGCALHNAFVRRDGYVVAIGLRPPPDGGREPRAFCFDPQGGLIAETPLEGCADTSPLVALDHSGRLHVVCALPQPQILVYEGLGLPPLMDRPAGPVERI